ncbi:MAG: alanine--tRNA ligase [Proteobacteria bacterium]|nr:alanine--tRNA ligase [Pseudomonadota bacterium]
MKQLTSNEIRYIFLEFFKEKNHTIVSSSSLVPNNDPTLLFTNAGMNQFKDYFLGQKKPKFLRAATSQKCIRAGGKHNDLENVGYTARHHTFFEMLGNFSFGDYFKKDAIIFAWELLTEKFHIPAAKLLVTVYHEDEEAYNIWKNTINLPNEKIIKIGDKSDKYISDNFWMMGDTGPCGPCSEIFYDHGSEIPGGPPGSQNEDGDRFIEIWNLVFMQYNRKDDGTMDLLPKPSVDTGMGLERISAVLQSVHSNYEIDLFQNLIKHSAKILGIKDNLLPSLKVIADHVRSITFLINDGVQPSNDGRGYVLRRIMRRAIRHGYKLGAQSPFLASIIQSVTDNMNEPYPELSLNIKKIQAITVQEEDKFFETIANGMDLLDREIIRLKTEQLNQIDGEIAFKLHDTYGFPIDMTADICRENHITIDQKVFDQEMEKQRNQAKSANNFKASVQIKIDKQPTIFHGYSNIKTESSIEAVIVDDNLVNEISGKQLCSLVVNNTPFYAESGGQVGDVGEIFNDQMTFTVSDTQKLPNGVIIHIGQITRGHIRLSDKVTCVVNVKRRDSIKRNHSATHLLHKALKSVLGDHVEQKGSLVDEFKTRFDFSHSGQMTSEQLCKVESLVNEEILKNNSTQAEIMPIEVAKKSGAMMLFGEKYDDNVRVLTIGNSKELCGGTHVSATGDIGLFKIISENGISSGVRRIEATTGFNILELLNKQDSLLNLSAKELKTSKEELSIKIKQVIDQIKDQEKQINLLKHKITNDSKSDLMNQVEIIKGNKVLIARLDAIETPQLRTLIDNLKDSIGSGIIILASTVDEKINIGVGITKDITNQYHAGKIASQIAEMVDGKGGGKPEMAMAGGHNIKQLPKALEHIKEILNT